MTLLKFALQFYTAYHRWITPGGRSVIVRLDWYKSQRLTYWYYNRNRRVHDADLIYVGVVGKSVNKVY